MENIYVESKLIKLFNTINSIINLNYMRSDKCIIGFAMMYVFIFLSEDTFHSKKKMLQPVPNIEVVSDLRKCFGGCLGTKTPISAPMIRKASQ